VHSALSIIEKYRLHSPPTVKTLYAMLLGEGVLVCSYRLAGRLAAVYCRTPDDVAVLAVRRGMPPEQLRPALALGLAQHALCPRPGVYVPGLEPPAARRELERFAALVLVPPGALARGDATADTGRLADRAGIPVLLAARRLEVAKHFGV